MTSKEPVERQTSTDLGFKRSELLRLRGDDVDLDQRINHDRSYASPLFTIAGFCLAMSVFVLNLSSDQGGGQSVIQVGCLVLVFALCGGTGVRLLSRASDHAKRLVATRKAILKLEDEVARD